MKLIYKIFIISIFSINITFAQNYHSGTITTNTKQSVKGRVSIDNKSKKVFYKKSGDSEVYTFSNVNNVTYGDVIYSKIIFEDKEYLVNSLVSGKASLYELTEDYFLIINNNTSREFNLNNDKHKIPGILSLLFNDCNSVRDEINLTAEFSKKTILTITNSYNNCSYENFIPTETEITRANKFNTDTYRFYAALQGSINSTIVNDYDANNSNGFGFGLGLAASPSFMSKLQGNIYIDLDFSMIFTGVNNYKNGSIPLNYKVNSYRLSLGLEYVFNKKGLLSPFLGIGYGHTSDYYNGTIGTVNFKDNKQNFFFIPKVGVIYKLKKENHLGLTVSYISEYENNLSFRYGEEFTYYPIVINNSFITIGLSYYF